jgi:hypothetical protein
LEKTYHDQGNSILPRLGQLLLEVHKRIFTNGKTTFESPQEKIVFLMERGTTKGI